MTQPENQTADDLPDLPSGWCWTTLDEVAHIEGGITKDQNRRRSSTVREVPYLRVANVQRGYLDLAELKTILAEEEEIQALRLQVGDILFTEGGDRDKLGRGWVWEGKIDECIHQNHIFRARPNLAAVEPKFVSLHGNFFGQSWFTRTGKQTTNLASINKGILRRFPVPLPPRNEQRRILAKVEELLSTSTPVPQPLERARANLKKYRAAVLKAAVTGELTAEWRAANPNVEPATKLLEKILAERRQSWEADQQVKFVKAGKPPHKNWPEKYPLPLGPDSSTLPGLPREWCWVTVEQVSEFARYGSSSKTGSNSSGVPVARMGNIQAGQLIMDDVKYLPHDHTEFPELLLEPGDLLFNRTNSAELVGKTAIYRGNPSPCSYASYLIAIRFLPGCRADSVAYYINSTFGRAWAKSVVAQQCGQANINGTKLQALAIPLPPLEEQEAIVSEVERQLSILNATEGYVDATKNRANNLRQSILKEAFAGRLVPQDPNDEPASSLLDRIRTARQVANGSTDVARPHRRRVSNYVDQPELPL